MSHAFACLLSVVVTSFCTGCRFAVYASSDTAIDGDALFVSPPHSLTKQSYLEPHVPNVDLSALFDPTKNEMRNHKCNRDGWGVAWKDHDKFQVRRSGTPITTLGVPAQNMVMAAKAAFGKIVFGHIRAATTGELSDVNSHPFLIDDLVWMHNGGLQKVSSAMEVLEGLPSNVSAQVLGTTDSELGGAIFATILRTVRASGGSGAETLARAMRCAVSLLTTPGNFSGLDWSRPCPSDLAPVSDCRKASSMNFAVSDGTSVVVTRFRNCDGEDPPSLYISTDGVSGSEATPGKATTRSLWISSEPLDLDHGQRRWLLLPKDSMVLFDTATESYEVSCLTDVCVEHCRTNRGEL